MNVSGSLPQKHFVHRIGWLRAAVLGANDGIISTASLILGVAAAQTSIGAILLAGTASLVAGATSMAAGEYVSVSSQADSQRADIAREKHELETNNAYEHKELAAIYVERGLQADLAKQVADQLMAGNALSAHVRDELGFSDTINARPIQAALASGSTFTLGAALPLSLAWMAPEPALIPMVAGGSLFCLLVLGSIAARTGGASMWRGALRVGFWGSLAMIATLAVGSLFDTAVV